MTDIKLLRQNIQDRDESKYDNETLQEMLDYYKDINVTASIIWMQYAGNASLRNFKFNIDGKSIDKTMTAKECREQAKYYQSLYRENKQLPADEIAEIDWGVYTC
ncbi:hypothetical protein [Vallitalea guaymasensis]|uniref:hypothetical protein n=1 Tax=Vallitalea guaymasensis TaxID=1185412 RepID=UPI000DE29E44|nr:hypothetical protein [Vallitalea guaymasensis]